MKILYVVSRPLEINTSASIRNRATILGLLQNGHKVDLITTEPDRNHVAFDESLVPKEIKVEYIKINGLQSVARMGRKISFLNPLRKYIYNFMSNHEIYDNLKKIVGFAPKFSSFLNQYDIVISSSDPKSSHLFVYEMIKRNNLFKGKWIQIWGDPFLNDITLSKKTNKSKIALEEKKLLALADKVAHVTKMTLEEQQKMYKGYAKKMIYLPIPYIEEKIYPVQELHEKKKVNLVYCGDYNPNVRNIIPLCEAVEQMQGIHLTICGNSSMTLRPYKNSTIYKRIPYKQVGELEAKADILVHLSNLYGTQIPGKIYQYSGTNKPILFILDGDKEKVMNQFEEFSRYIFSENEVSKIKSAIESIIEKEQNYTPVNFFSKERICKILLDYMDTDYD